MSNHRNQTQSLNTCIGKTAWSAPLTLEHEDAEAREVEEFEAARQPYGLGGNLLS